MATILEESIENFKYFTKNLSKNVIQFSFKHILLLGLRKFRKTPKFSAESLPIEYEKYQKQIEGGVRLKIAKAYNIQDSQAVSDPSTNWTQRCLTCQIGRDGVYST